MDLKAYLNSLVNVFRKNDILDDFFRVSEELKEFIEPSYTLSKVPNFAGFTYKTIATVFRKEIDSRNTDPYKIIAETVQTILANQDLIEKTIRKDFTEERIKETSDYYTLNLLRYFEALHGFNEYAKKFIMVVSWETLQENVEYFKREKTYVILREYQRDITNYDDTIAFANIINRLNKPFDKYLDDIEDLKGRVFTDSDFSNDTPINISKQLDPHRTKFVNVNLNPAYHIGLAYNAWQDKRYKRNIEEKAQLQLILLGLSEDLIDEKDETRIAALNKQIEYYANLVNKLDISIKEMEGKD